MPNFPDIESCPIRTDTEFDNFTPDTICERSGDYITGNDFIDTFIRNWIALNNLSDPSEAEESDGQTTYNLYSSHGRSCTLRLHYDESNSHIQDIYLTDSYGWYNTTITRIQASKDGSLRLSVFKSFENEMKLSSGLIVYPSGQPSLFLQRKPEEEKDEFESFRVPAGLNNLWATTISNTRRPYHESPEAIAFSQYRTNYPQIMGAIKNSHPSTVTTLLPNTNWQDTSMSLPIYDASSRSVINPELDINLPLNQFSNLWIEEQDQVGNTIFHVETQPRECVITLSPEGEIISTFNKKRDEHYSNAHIYTTFARTYNGETVKIVTIGSAYSRQPESFYKYTVIITPIPNNGETQRYQTIKLNGNMQVRKMTYEEIF